MEAILAGWKDGGKRSVLALAHSVREFKLWSVNVLCDWRAGRINLVVGPKNRPAPSRTRHHAPMFPVKPSILQPNEAPNEARLRTNRLSELLGKSFDVPITIVARCDFRQWKRHAVSDPVTQSHQIIETVRIVDDTQPGTHYCRLRSWVNSILRCRLQLHYSWSRSTGVRPSRVRGLAACVDSHQV
jgi:hypothetical protein